MAALGIARLGAMLCETGAASEGVMQMGVKEALALIEREEAQAAQPAKRGVVAWVADRFWWSESGLMLRRTK